MKITLTFRAQLLWTLLFLILRVTGVTGWSWVWVLSPLWVPYVFFGTLVAFIVGVSVLSGKGLPKVRRLDK
jgi:hypothetical protein